ncbi:phage tail terminator-like protein [Sinorhizobium meliloti]|uniref:phage tail terminator-like protein n=1 Tax=Rhizobium meliloti TaxID=382 RepID=UPI003F1415B0
MAAGTDAIIFKAVTDRLLAMPGVLPVAAPNVVFPAAGQPLPPKYLRLAFLPNQTRQITMGNDPQQKRGLFQVSVVWPVGQGIIGALDVADQVINHFKNQSLFASDVKITISSEPWAAGPLQEGERVHIPVTIPYIAFEPEN